MDPQVNRRVPIARDRHKDVVVMSQACDLEYGKDDIVLVCPMQPFKKTVEAWRAECVRDLDRVSGEPLNLRDGMNKFLKEMNITFRRDPETGRPRANKSGSVKDREQKSKGEYYYSG